MAAHGFNGFIGFAKESSAGTAVAATNYVEALSENFALSIDRYITKAITGKLQEPDDEAGLRRIQGSITAPFHPQDGGHFLNMVLGLNTQTTVLSGFLWNNEFKFRTTDFDELFAQQPYTFEIFRDVSSSQRYAGALGSSLEFNVTGNQALNTTVELIGLSATNIAKTTATFTNSPTSPFTFDSCSVSIGGAGSTLLESMTVKFDNQLEGQSTLNLSTNLRAIRRSGPQMISIGGTVTFENMTEYSKFIDQTEQAFLFNFTKASSFAMLIDLPRVIYTAFPLGIQGAGKISVSFEGKGRYHTGSASNGRVRLTTTRSFF